MKKVITKTAALVTAFALTAGIYAPAAVSAMGSQTTFTGTMITEAASLEAMMNFGSMSVNGNGSIMADPDMATANIGIEVTASSAIEAQAEAALAIGKIVEALKKVGIEEKDIQTSNYYMYQKHDWSRSMVIFSDPDAVPEPEDPDYAVTISLTVTIRDIDIVGEVIEAATEAGANQNQGIWFGIEDRDTLYMDALLLAIEDAQKKADVIAKALGVDIGLPTSVFESYSYISPRWDYGYGSGMAVMSSYESSGMSVQAGQVEVTASVSVGYSFERK